MNRNSPFLEVAQSCSRAVEWLIQRLGQGGIQAIRTFDLQTTRQYPDFCQCTKHGTQQCDCQMVVLLLYPQGDPPISIVAHGNGCQTWFSLVDTPQQRPNSHLVALLLSLVTGEALQSECIEEHSLAE